MNKEDIDELLNFNYLTNTANTNTNTNTNNNTQATTVINENKDDNKKNERPNVTSPLYIDFNFINEYNDYQKNKIKRKKRKQNNTNNNNNNNTYIKNNNKKRKVDIWSETISDSDDSSIDGELIDIKEYKKLHSTNLGKDYINQRIQYLNELKEKYNKHIQRKEKKELEELDFPIFISSLSQDEYKCKEILCNLGIDKTKLQSNECIDIIKKCDDYELYKIIHCICYSPGTISAGDRIILGDYILKRKSKYKYESFYLINRFGNSKSMVRKSTRRKKHVITYNDDYYLKLN